MFSVTQDSTAEEGSDSSSEEEIEEPPAKKIPGKYKVSTIYKQLLIMYEWKFTGEIIQIVVHSTHTSVSDWLKVYIEFPKSASRMSSSCRLYNSHVEDTKGRR